MECDHRLSFREIMRLEGQLSLSRAITYTCSACGQPCELELKNEWKALAIALSVLLFVIAAAILLPALGGIHFLLNVLAAALCLAVLAGVYVGMMYLYFRLGLFRFTTAQYHSITGRRVSARK